MNYGGPPLQRPRTSAGVVNNLLSPRDNAFASFALRPSPTSIDLTRDDLSFSPPPGPPPPLPPLPSSAVPKPSPLHDISRTFSHVKKDILGMVRSRMPRVTGNKQNRLSSRRHNETPALPAMSSNSPPRPRREPSRRHNRLSDRQRRNALFPGGSAARQSDETQTCAPLQAPQTWLAQTLRSGQGAKAAVAATRRQKLEEATTKLDHLYQPPSPDSGNDSAMELDSAFGDTTPTDAMQVELTACAEENLILKMLPGEIFLEILEYLDFKDLGNAALACKTWSHFAASPTVLRGAYMSQYHRRTSFPSPYIQIGGLGIGRPFAQQPAQNWKAMAKARTEISDNWKHNRARAIYFEGHTDSVYCCQFDEDKIITGSRDRTIRVWDIHTYQCIRVIGGPAYRPAAPSSAERLATVDETVYSGENMNGTKSGDQLFHIPREHHAASILCLQYDHEILVTGSSDHTCIVWDLKTWEPLTRLRNHSAGVLDVCLDRDFIISCSKDLTICVWSRHTYELLKVLTGHNGPVNAVQLRGKLLASASGDGRCKLWDLSDLQNRKMEEILVRTFQSADRGLAAVEFTDDTKYVLAGGNDQVIYKFRCADGAEVGKYAGHTGLVRSLFLDYSNKRVLSGSYDQGIRVYDFDSHDTIGSYVNWTTSWILAAKSDYRRIVATSQDGRVLLMDFGLDVDNVHLLNGNDNEPSSRPAAVDAKLREPKDRAIEMSSGP